ncbi:MAG: hypothetical protein ACD_49C00076G0008 [uncultured bacterium (gcode 4)]|uniref:Fibronectin type-III domain-containing protein n=1 Tax=uncultured bacterium (gcode 4) TaxID=1234023 RepID=K2AVJ8_9BACT|nr:MAG: hypothetical protein ACD_49C00076G0008 [uncultured bacterium (gcode 4)]
MKNIKKIIALVSVALFIQTVGAATWTTVTTGGTTVTTSADASLELPTPPRLVNKTSTWVTLEWDSVSAASGYIVLYSKTSVATSTDPNALYDNETDQVAWTWTTVSGLEANTKYYFAVVPVDKEWNQGSTFSSELSVSTDSSTSTATGATATSSSSLALSGVTVIDNKTLAVQFNAMLWAEPITLKITKTSDNSDIAVSEIVPDATLKDTVAVKLNTVLDPSSSYSLTVISAKDEAWNNISEGVNGIKEFTTLATLASAPELNSASWATMSGATLPDAKALPATWTKENLIVLAALILSFGIVFIYRRKFVK